MKNFIGRTPLYWKHNRAHLNDLCQRKGNPTGHNHNNNTKFEINQPVMVKNHAHHTFKPKYLLDCKVLKYLMTAHSCSLHQMAKKEKQILTMLNLAAQQNFSKMPGICF